MARSSRKTKKAVTVASAAALASLMGAPAASAQEVCVTCPPGLSPGQANAFLKLASPSPALFKVSPTALGKMSPVAVTKWTTAFPGNTENVFYKE